MTVKREGARRVRAPPLLPPPHPFSCRTFWKLLHSSRDDDPFRRGREADGVGERVESQTRACYSLESLSAELPNATPRVESLKPRLSGLHIKSQARRKVVSRATNV
jgi:hypothetical protein